MEREDLMQQIAELAEVAMAAGEEQAGWVLASLSVCMENPRSYEAFHQEVRAAYQRVLEDVPETRRRW